jgi:hypothetical protein
MHVAKIFMDGGHFGDQGLNGSFCENVWFEVLWPLTMNGAVFWYVLKWIKLNLPCSLIEVTSLVFARFALQSWSWRHSPEQLVIFYQITLYYTPGMQYSYVRSWQHFHTYAQNNSCRYFIPRDVHKLITSLPLVATGFFVVHSFNKLNIGRCRNICNTIFTFVQSLHWLINNSPQKFCMVLSFHYLGHLLS